MSTDGVIILTNRSFWDSKLLYDSWSSRSKNLVLQLKQLKDNEKISHGERRGINYKQL